MNAAAAGFQNGLLHAGGDRDVAAACAGIHFAARTRDVNGAAASFEFKVRARAIHVNTAAASLGLNRAVDALEMNATATTFRVYFPFDVFYQNAAAVGFNFYGFHVFRDVDDKLTGEAVRTAVFPLGGDPRSITAHAGGDFVTFKYVTRFFFG